MINAKKLITLCVALCIPLCSSAASNYPINPVQLLVPFGAGGSIDITARALSKAMEKELGQPVVVVNKPGAGGSIALSEVARSKPDGYTLGIMLAANAAIAPHIHKVSYDPLKDLTPVANYSTSLIYVAVAADSPYKTLEDLLKDMKARPNAVMIGITTLGSTSHLSTARMMRERDLETEYITFGGGAQVITALLGGHIPVATLAGEALPYVSSGKIRFLASFTSSSVPALASVPTIQASGFNWEAASWVGIAGPAGMPENVRNKLEQAVLKAIEDPDFLRVTEDMAMVAQPMTASQLSETLDRSYKEMGDLVKAVGLEAR